MRTVTLFIMAALMMTMFSACGGSSSGSGVLSSAPTPVEATYYSEFSDILIPRDMKEVSKHTSIIHNQDGSKAGTQVFEGNVELQSLMNAMLYNMTQQGWAPRSIFRGQRSAMMFEKGNSVAMITAADGSFTTTMELWVAKRIEDGALVQEMTPQTYYAPLLEGNP